MGDRLRWCLLALAVTIQCVSGLCGGYATLAIGTVASDYFTIDRPQLASALEFHIEVIGNYTLVQPPVEGHVYNSENLLEEQLGSDVPRTVVSLEWKGNVGTATVHFSSFAAPQFARAIFRSKPGAAVIALKTRISYVPDNPSFWRATGIIIGVIMLASLPFLVILASFYLDSSRFTWERIGPNQYPYFPPRPVEFLLKYKKGYRLESMWMQPIHGFRIYHLNHHDILWIWFPDDDEPLNRRRRTLVTLFTVWFVFLFQFYWNDFLSAWADDIIDETAVVSPKSGAAGGAFLAFLLRFFMADIVAVLARFFGRKLFSNLHTNPTKMLCAGSDNPNKTKAGVVINWAAIALLLVSFFLLLGDLIFVERKFTFGYVLVWSFVPFLASLIWRTAAVSLLWSFVLYRLKCTFGAENPTVNVKSEHEKLFDGSRGYGSVGDFNEGEEV
ncbi:hypothetical protein PROFUN_06655 [Planoprotostelium fungivorum]|uniref:Transmembrane protein n=1 Tax=Planoprotostelium fungivorum TaxID=1890364 RepID=A0A2P6MSX3_9EUKA|nr:hypothetical protein PROFUN_06655 [Planoprotostelium fungivorum]